MLMFFVIGNRNEGKKLALQLILDILKILHQFWPRPVIKVSFFVVLLYSLLMGVAFFSFHNLSVHFCVCPPFVIEVTISSQKKQLFFKKMDKLDPDSNILSHDFSKCCQWCRGNPFKTQKNSGSVDPSEKSEKTCPSDEAISLVVGHLQTHQEIAAIIY